MLWPPSLKAKVVPIWRRPIYSRVNDEGSRSHTRFAECNVNCFNGPKWQEMHNIHLLYNTTIIDLCFGRHGVLMNNKLNHIDIRSASVNMTFTVQ